MAVKKLKLEKQSLGQDDWGYVNARIKGMKSSLLSKDKIEDILKQSGLRGVISLLQDTAYGPFIQEAQKKYTVGISEVEIVCWALKNNMSATVQKLRILMGERSAGLLNFLLERWDVYNIKTILRGRHAGISPAEISQNLFPIGMLSEDLLEKMCQDNEISIKDIVDTLINFWGVSKKDKKIIDTSWEVYSGTGNLLELELELDRIFYKRYLLKADSIDKEGKLLKIIKIDVDIANIMMIFRLAKSRIDEAHIKKFFLKGGKAIKESMFVSLAAKNDVEEIIKQLDGVEFYQTMLERLPLFKRLKDISIFERSLSGFLLCRIRGIFRIDVFGVGILVSYLEQKFNEVVNLRIIVRSKEFGMPDEIARGELIFA